METREMEVASNVELSHAVFVDNEAKENSCNLEDDETVNEVTKNR